MKSGTPTLSAMPRAFAASTLAIALACGAAPVQAQSPADQDGSGRPPAQPDVPVPSRGQTYEPAYFDQFGPRNALDMVARIPGFEISGGGGGGSGGGGGQRGLGQADENVLINGARLSSKSDGVRDQLRRIPAGNVVRIEVVDGTSLDIPGLSGQVANIIATTSGISGSFRWQGGFRPHNTEAELYGGEASVTGSSGALDWTVAIDVTNNRFGADGETLFTDANGVLIEREDTQFSGKFDQPRASLALNYDFAPDVTANFNAAYEKSFFRADETEIGFPVGGPRRDRSILRDRGGPEWEISSDIVFPFGPGNLKLIGLTGRDNGGGFTEVVDRFDDGSIPAGSRFANYSKRAETIGRFEYSWPMLGGDWQISGEAAYNTLDRVSSLFELDPGGTFVEIDFPEGTGGVAEDRYEAILSFSRALGSTLALQVSAGGEYSKIEQSGAAANTRSFQRPKGAMALSWTPGSGFDAALELRRSVGQLSFGDFLASVSLQDENQNAGNNELVPEQSWDLSLELNKTLGEWGSIGIDAERRWISDYIDFIPVAGGGEARGNIDSAQRTDLGMNATIRFDPLGWNGAQLEIEGEKRWTSLIDPFSGQSRAFSAFTDFRFDVELRHDIPGSDWAYGSQFEGFHNTQYFRSSEIGREYEGPTFLALFIEHKDVFGLTVNAQARNVNGGRQYFERVVFDGERPGAPIAFFEDRDRRIGPIFRLQVSGNF